MTSIFYIILSMCVYSAVAAPPPSSARVYHQYPEPIQQVNQLDYYLEQPDVTGYYPQVQQKEDPHLAQQQSADPKTEVELLPGAQVPQQPPQQAPVAPSIPGLLPGQRVFIVHMPVPGYMPGSIGGYQPVYIVAAGAQGNTGVGYPNAFPNAFLLDPSGQVAVNPFLGYSRPGLVPVGVNYGAGQTQFLNRPFDSPYPEQGAYPSAGQVQASEPSADDSPRNVLLSQLVALQRGQQTDNIETAPRTPSTDNSNTEPKRTTTGESKDAEEPRHNARPHPPHAQTRKP